MDKQIRFSNSSRQDRTEVGYGIIPFKKGEWDGVDPLEVIDSRGTRVDDAWVYPIGAKYEDGTYRYGALLSRLTIAGKSEVIVTIHPATMRISEPQFKFAPNLVNGKPFSIFVVATQRGQSQITNFSGLWKIIEARGMRYVYEARARIGDFVAVLKLYVYRDQVLVNWELDIIGSNPDVTERVYPFDDLQLGIFGEDRYLNVRHMSRRGVEVISPFKHFCLMKGQDGFFGDGQGQSWYGELVTVVSDPEIIASQAAATEFSMWGISKNWVDAGEAFGAARAVPDTPMPLPNNGLAAIAAKYVKLWRYINSNGHPWEDYPEGLTKTPSQTGGQSDFGIIKGWDVLWTGMGELVEFYRFLATEDIKRPGHYLETDGSPVTHINHPRWVTWDGQTHWDFSVSPDRLGKIDPNAPISTNGWGGKDWQHFSSNLLYLAALLTGSHQLRDLQEQEAEIFLAGHTLPSKFPNWSTNGRGEARGFGRTHLALLHHHTLLNRQDVIDHMMNRFKEVVRDQWTGATNSPVQPWSLTNDPRVFANGQTAWVPWNNNLGWIGIYCLWLLTKDPDIEKVMIGWGTTLVNWGWRISANSSTNLGHGVKWLTGGAPITAAQFNDPNFWLPVRSFNEEWGLACCVFAKSSSLFDATTQLRAQTIYNNREQRRLANYQSVTNPFDEFGNWTAL